jgi:hypothetical protein
MTTSISPREFRNWRPAPALWLELAEQQPHLAISPTVTSWYGFFRHHREALVAAGVVVRLTSRSWLADPAHFAAAVTAIKCGSAIERIEVRQRKAKDAA